MSPTENPESQDRIAQLTGAAHRLILEVEELSGDSGRQMVNLSQAARRNRLMIWGLVASVALDVMLTVVISIIGAGVAKNTERLDTFSQNLSQQQTEQRRRALCPLYGVFLDSKSDQGRANAPDPEKYDHAFEVMEDGYQVLGCARFLEESGKDKW